MAAQAAVDKLGMDVLALDVRQQTSVTDCFLFVSGQSGLHCRALEDAIREALGTAGSQLKRTDGHRGMRWRALDYGSLIIHIMDQPTREFYSIERLWNQAKKVPLTSATSQSHPKKKPTNSSFPRKRGSRV